MKHGFWFLVVGFPLWWGCRDRTAEAPAPTSPQVALDRLDTRAKVALLPMMAHHQKRNMRDHLAAVQDIVAALATEDFAAAETAAQKIGLTAEMGQTCNDLGSAAPGFGEQGVAFHRTADGIAGAARAHDRNRALSELAATLASCNGCHAVWKQEVVDEATWSQLAKPVP